jgi:hypothetical protein
MNLKALFPNNVMTAMFLLGKKCKIIQSDCGAVPEKEN